MILSSKGRAVQRSRRILATIRPTPLSSRASIHTRHQCLYPSIHPVTRNMRVVQVPVNTDNYAYLIVDDKHKIAAAVDPCGAEKVLGAAQQQGVSVKAILTTHHHWDHAGGNKAMLQQLPDLPVYGGDNRVEAISKLVKQDDTFEIGDIQVKVHSTPCHTSGHVLYEVKDKSDPSQPIALFTGDTLFIGGCGRFFEGSPEQMYHALCEVVASFPGNTQVFCGHEYTLKNLQFAASIEPNNPAVKEKLKFAEDCKAKGLSTVPSTVAEEKKYNPFMRVDHDSVQEALGLKGHSAFQVMRELRARKDNF